MKGLDDTGRRRVVEVVMNIGFTVSNALRYCILIATSQRLCGALTERGHKVVASDRMDRLPHSLQEKLGR